MSFERGINWKIGIFLVLYHLGLLLFLPPYLYSHSPSMGIWIGAFFLYVATGMSITTGYHRYYAHRAYKAHPIVEAVLLFFGTMAGQGSVLRWSYDHRLHHAYTDSNDDPYSIQKGFWYAHMTWLFEKPRTIEPSVVNDLWKRPIMQFQHRHYKFLFTGVNIFAWLFLGYLCSDYLGAFIITWWLRLFFSHHTTWLINSAAHTWGDKPFCQEQSAVNNYILSLLTFGEGYHNYHHAFANDYRNGVRWFHFDPTKWLIWVLSCFGLTWNLKKVDHISIYKRMVLQRKELLLKEVKELWDAKRDELEKLVSEQAEKLLEKLSELKQLTDQATNRKEWKNELKKLQASFQKEWKEWTRLSQEILATAT